MNRKDGGAAFPREDYQTDCLRGQHGMSLRDYFAAKFAHAELLTAGQDQEAAEDLSDAADAAGQTIEARIAFNAYVLADAMLAERDK